MSAEVRPKRKAALSQVTARDMLAVPLCDLRTQFELTLQIIPNREPVLSRPTVKPTMIGSHDLGGGCPPYLKSGVNQSLLRRRAEAFSLTACHSRTQQGDDLICRTCLSVNSGSAAVMPGVLRYIRFLVLLMWTGLKFDPSRTWPTS